MVHPNVASSKDGDPISIADSSPPVMRGRIPHHSISCRLTIVNMNAVDDDVTHILNGDTWPIFNMDIHTPSVDCLETVHHQLFLELDHHISLEDDREGLYLTHGMTQSIVGSHLR